MQLRNEYPEYFLAGKGGQCVGLTILPTSCADCHEIWEPPSWNTHGRVQACAAIAYIKLHCVISLMSQIAITAMLLLLIVKRLGLGSLIMANVYFVFRENLPG